MNYKSYEFVPVSVSVVDGIVFVKTKGRKPYVATLSKTASAKVIKTVLTTSKKVWAAFNNLGKVAILTNGSGVLTIIKTVEFINTPSDLKELFAKSAEQASDTSVVETPAPKKAVRKPKAKTLKDFVKVIDGVEYVRLADVQLINSLSK